MIASPTFSEELVVICRLNCLTMIYIMYKEINNASPAHIIKLITNYIIFILEFQNSLNAQFIRSFTK